MKDSDWMVDANCKDTDSDYFFTQGDATAYEDKNLISRICSNCDVLKECQDYSIKYDVLGWWGNTSEKQRRDIRQKLNITPIQIVSERVYE